ncbi:MAG: amidohydrolase family protein [Clostridiales bacterium]|nr:amidohydrolase family protein [Clostridiales bacterium]
MLTYSSFALPYLDVLSPQRLDRVARKFSNLKIIVAHGGWPWVRESISLALVLPNVYLIPDIYGTNGPGAQDYITAANTVLSDKIVYGSSYPILHLEDSVDFVKEKWDLTEENEEKVLYKNAAQILGLE